MIQPTSNFPGYYRTDALSNSSSQKAPALKAEANNSESLSSANTQTLREALAQTAEIRPGVVERAKALAVDPNYPPREIIESLARLMVSSRDLSASS